ncbi:MAG: 30S ribosomal protein S17 [Anaerolineae bacterium]|nr:30S ribosomal protein S17 [Anaerolineae bacterium]MDH7473494.1 30S ribosomal protein S17 [Anaerolineae bacterium]
MRERRKQLIGRVVSNKMDKTVVVKVERLQRHSLYKKVMRRSKKYKAHDEHNSCQVGDLVRIVESRPLSREKRWVVEEILEAGGAESQPVIE